MNQYIFGYCSDKGAVRESNQDSLCLKMAETADGEKIVLAALCDGMGGYSFGEKASAAVIRSISNWFMQQLPRVLDKGEVEIRKSLEENLLDVNRRIKEFGRKENATLGTTLALLLLRNGRYMACNVGDSRIYQLGSGQIEQVTHDHSLVARLVSQGVLTPKEARTDSRRNILTQAISTNGSFTPEYYSGRVYAGTMFLLCSDGFYHEMPEQEMLERLYPLRTNDELSAEAKRCIHDIIRRGEKDNLTALLIKT